MEIRPARMEDMEAAYALMCDMEATELDRGAFRRIYGETVRNPSTPCLVAEEDGAVAGFLHLRMEEQLHHCEKIAEVMELIVRSDVRSRGTGAQLLKEAARIAQENGCVLIEVASNRARERAHAFYQRQGMVLTHYKLTMPIPSAQSKG